MVFVKSTDLLDKRNLFYKPAFIAALQGKSNIPLNTI